MCRVSEATRAKDTVVDHHLDGQLSDEEKNAIERKQHQRNDNAALTRQKDNIGQRQNNGEPVRVDAPTVPRGQK